MKHLYTLHIGTESRADGTAILPTESQAAIRDLKTQAAIQFCGYSAALISGGWYDWDRQVLVEELSLRLEVVSHDADAVRRFAATAAEHLEQSCVMLTNPDGRVEFVTATEAAAAAA